MTMCRNQPKVVIKLTVNIFVVLNRRNAIITMLYGRLIIDVTKNTLQFCSTPDIIYATMINNALGSIIYITLSAVSYRFLSSPGSRIFTQSGAETYKNAVIAITIIDVFLMK